MNPYPWPPLPSLCSSVILSSIIILTEMLQTNSNNRSNKFFNKILIVSDQNTSKTNLSPWLFLSNKFYKNVQNWVIRKCEKKSQILTFKILEINYHRTNVPQQQSSTVWLLLLGSLWLSNHWSFKVNQLIRMIT